MKIKNRLILQAFLCVCVKLQSQTLTCQYNCPQAGEVFSMKTASPVVHTSGLNQLWNFTQMQAVSPGISTLSYVDPGSVSTSSLFPQANVAKLESGNYTFLDSGNNGVKLASLGSATVNAESLVLPLPFSYGSSHTETIITKYQNSADLVEITSKKNLNGVGAGTLMLPAGTYTDVLRISGKVVESRTKNGQPDGYVYTTTINYYYSEKISHPLLYSEYKEENGPGDYGPFTQFVSGIPTGIKNENNAFRSGMTIAPNPASDIVQVTALANESGEITLTNALGEVVLHQRYSGGAAEFDLRGLPEGLYTIRIMQPGNVQSKKLVVTR